MADSKKQKALAKAVKTGTYQKSSVGARARAAANKLKNNPAPVETRNGPKVSETVHLQPQQFTRLPETYIGRHRGMNTAGAMRNARGGSSYEGTRRKFNWFSKAA